MMLKYLCLVGTSLVFRKFALQTKSLIPNAGTRIEADEKNCKGKEFHFKRSLFMSV
jgi:hypothetical protein